MRGERMGVLYELAEQAAAVAVWTTFAPLLGSLSLLGTRGAITGAALCGRGDSVRATPDEIRAIAPTAADLAERGQAVTEVAVRIRNAGGEIVGTVDFIWLLGHSRAPSRP